jgi:hypothetical protein
MTKAEVLTEWETLAQAHRGHARYQAAADWVGVNLAGHREELCEVWLAALHVAVSDEEAGDPNPVVLNPPVMMAIMQAVKSDYGDTERERSEKFVRDMGALIRERQAETIGQHEYVERLQAIQREGGMPVYDGFTPEIVYEGPTPNSPGQPIHPGLLRECADLLPERYHKAAKVQTMTTAAPEAAA